MSETFKAYLEAIVTCILLMIAIVFLGCVVLLGGALIFFPDQNYDNPNVGRLETPPFATPSDIGAFIRIEGGSFQMGAPPITRWHFGTMSKYWFDSAYPSHTETVPSFEIGKYKVTAKEFAEFLNDEIGPGGEVSKYVYIGNNGTLARIGDAYAPLPGYELAPATRVTYLGARRYCAWLSRKTGRTCRLPSEVEWEYTARGSNNRTYPWGEDSPLTRCYLAARYEERSNVPEVCNVGTFPTGATPEGVQDLIGNGAEWCGNYHFWYTDQGITSGKTNLHDFADPPLPVDYRDASLQLTTQRGGQYINLGDFATGYTRSTGGMPLLYGHDGNTFRVLRELE